MVQSYYQDGMCQLSRSHLFERWCLPVHCLSVSVLTRFLFSLSWYLIKPVFWLTCSWFLLKWFHNLPFVFCTIPKPTMLLGIQNRSSCALFGSENSPSNLTRVSNIELSQFDTKWIRQPIRQKFPCQRVQIVSLIIMAIFGLTKNERKKLTESHLLSLSNNPRERSHSPRFGLTLLCFQKTIFCSSLWNTRKSISFSEHLIHFG